MLGKLLILYWRESCSWRTAVFLLIMVLITFASFTGINQPAEQNLTVFTPVRISVVDEDRSLVSYAIVSQFAALPSVENVYTESLTEARARLDQNEVLLILVIPSDFYRDVVTRTDPARITVYLNDRMPAESAYFMRMLDNSAGSISAIQAALAVFQREAEPLLPDKKAFSRQSEAAALSMAFRLLDRESLIQIQPGNRLNTAWFIITALSCLFSVLPALLVLLMAQQERETGRHERLLIANVSWLHLHLAKILVGLLWLTASILPMLVILKRMLPQISLPVVLLAILLLYLIAALFCLTLAYRSRHTEALMLTAWLSLMAALLLGGSIYPDLLLPPLVSQAGMASPVHWTFRLIYEAIGGHVSLAMPLAVLSAELLLILAASRWSLRSAR